MGNNPAHRQIAEETAELIAKRGLTLVYGGGNVGLMGVIADAALAKGGTVIGVIPSFLHRKEVAHQGLTQIHYVETMHERKALMADLSDAFLALPGGYGTLDEFCEILTWGQLGLHKKPMGILNAYGYFDSLLTFFDDAVTHGFISESLRATVLESSTPENILEQLAMHEQTSIG
jgi:uncharacterized protein (TIGR00730 family)